MVDSSKEIVSDWCNRTKYIWTSVIVHTRPTQVQTSEYPSTKKGKYT